MKRPAEIAAVPRSHASRFCAETCPSPRAGDLRLAVRQTEQIGRAVQPAFLRRIPGWSSRRAHRCRRRGGRRNGSVVPPVARADQAAGAAAHRLAWAGARRGCRRRGSGREDCRAWRTSGRSGDHGKDLRDDVAGALQHHGVADANILARDLVLVVQRGALHQHAADIDRLQLAPPGVSAPVRPTWMSMSSSTVMACSAGNFQRDRPARCPAHEAEPALQARSSIL